jgi:hypothetical protein
MARLGDQNPRAMQLTFTKCPDTDVYMPPEAVKDKPVYTEKIDCFSFGVIAVQYVTRQVPKPGDRREEIQVNQPGLPPIVEVPVLEIKRRQSHIGKIDPKHTLLPVALNCLKDRDVECPSAQQLCESVAALKEGPQYSESMRVVETRSTIEQDRSDERDGELRSLRQQYTQQVQDLQQVIQLQTNHLEEKEQIITRKEQTIAQNEEIIAQLAQQLGEKAGELTEKVSEIDGLERKLGCINQQLEESEQINAQFRRRTAELEQVKLATDTSSSSKEQRTSIKLTWREGKKALCSMSESYHAAVDDSTLYVVVACQAFCYTISTSSWSQLPTNPTFNCPSVIINKLLTLVGGRCFGTSTITNQLFSLTG